MQDRAIALTVLYLVLGGGVASKKTGLHVREYEPPLCPYYSQNEERNAHRMLVSNGDFGASSMPPNYRTSADPIDQHVPRYEERHGPVPGVKLPSLIGYAATRMAGSAQFNARQLKQVREINPNLVIVDLRMEAHFLVDDDIATSFYCPRNWDRLLVKDPQVLRERELEDVAMLASQQPRGIRIGNKASTAKCAPLVRFTQIRTEAELTASLGLRYHRFYIADHSRPRDDQIDTIVQWLRAHEDDHVLMHCNAGKGRTTTFMIMRDMLRNAKALPLHDLLMRNYIYSAYNMEAMIEERRGSYQEGLRRERLAFLYAFYEYCRHPKGLSWQHYVREQSRELLSLGTLLNRAVLWILGSVSSSPEGRHQGLVAAV